MNIAKLKKSFELPIKKDEMEYFGPIDHQLSNSFLNMGHDFMQSYFVDIPRILRKKLFTVFIELIQNIADYNEKSGNQNKHAFVKLTVDRGEISIKTVNFIIQNDVDGLEAKLERTFGLNEEQLMMEYKEALMRGKSLGLIMIRCMEGSDFAYKMESKEGENYLGLEFRIKDKN